MASLGNDRVSAEAGAAAGTRSKVVVVGDGLCGKTSMLLRFTRNEFPDKYIPTVCEATTADIQVDGTVQSLVLWDTAGQEDYDRLRPLCYGRTNVVIVCFSVSDRNSFDNVVNKWMPEVRHFCPGVSVLLVATKIDLRQVPAGGDLSRSAESCISAANGSRLASDVGARLYVECSALTGEGVGLVFEMVARLADQQRKEQQPVNKLKCLLL
jgi:small GTP-binding protein